LSHAWCQASPHPPQRPQTNGRAERFIRTRFSGWPYGAIDRSSSERTAALAGWLGWFGAAVCSGPTADVRAHRYNIRRPHGALSHKPPTARLNELNNLLGSYT